MKSSIETNNLLYFKLIVSGLAGQQVDHVLKVVVVGHKSLQEPKLSLKVMVDLVQAQAKKQILVIRKTVPQVSFLIPYDF